MIPRVLDLVPQTGPQFQLPLPTSHTSLYVRLLMLRFFLRTGKLTAELADVEILSAGEQGPHCKESPCASLSAEL